MIFKGTAKYAIFLLMTLSSALCFAEIVNLSAGATATASNSLPAHSPMAAIDSNNESGWNSGIAPAQWIEIDLGARKEISEIKALVDQTPAGETVHNIYFDNILGHTWAGITDKNGLLSVVLPTKISAQKIRIETITSPSWVGWYEIAILGSNTVVGPSAAYKKNSATLSGAFDISIPVIEYNSGQQQFFYSAKLTSAGKNSAGDLLWKLTSSAPTTAAPLNTVSSHLSNSPSPFFMKLDSVQQGQSNYWAQLEYVGNETEFVWKLIDFGLNQ